MRAQVRRENPDLNSTLIKMIMLEMWSNLPQETKAEYERKEREAREEYERKMREYKTSQAVGSLLPTGNGGIGGGGDLLSGTGGGGLFSNGSGGGLLSGNGGNVGLLGQSGDQPLPSASDNPSTGDVREGQVKPPRDMNNSTLHIVHIMPTDKKGQLLYAINAMSQFKGKSLEELRNEDYDLMDNRDSLCESDRQALEAKIEGNSVDFLCL